MPASKGPSQEQLKLLGELSAGTGSKEDLVLSKVPDWRSLQEKKIVSFSVASALLELNSLTSSLDRVEHIRSNPDVVTLPFTLMQKASLEEAHVVEYILTLFYDIVRNDTSVLDDMLAACQTQTIWDAFQKFLSRTSFDTFTVDKAIFLLSSLIPRAQHKAFSDEQVNQLIENCVNGTWKLTNHGRLDCFKNLMKLGRYRTVIWESSGARQLIVTHLDVAKGCLYPAVFSAWLLTFNPSLLKPFTEMGALEKVCAILRQSKTEKVVRICIHILLNCLPDDQSVEALIEQNVVHTLTLLEYEKWRDEELYQEIRDGLAALQHKIKLFSNFDRYCRELETGKMRWSFLHSNKFWHQNVMHFEENEFLAVKKLAMLLRSQDLVTSAVACFDLGEFARLHPMGKKIIQKIKAKEMVMMLMSHKDRDVSREALLCIQKMMLDGWQNAATTAAA